MVPFEALAFHPGLGKSIKTLLLSPALSLNIIVLISPSVVEAGSTK